MICRFAVNLMVGQHKTMQAAPLGLPWWNVFRERHSPLTRSGASGELASKSSLHSLLYKAIFSYKLQVKGLTASQVVRLIGLLLVFASQKIVHNVRNEMAEVIQGYL